MTRRPVIIDCDPGVDDALAMMLALGSPEELEVLGVCAVAGNVTLERTAINAQRILALAGRGDIPVHAGSATPMLINLHTAKVHGHDGVGGAPLPEPTASLASHDAVGYLCDRLAGRPSDITLCCLGPLTNLGLALTRDQQILSNAQDIVIMGGADGRGNVTPFAEFNYFVDPHAAQLVFRSGVETVMFGLNLTRQVPITPARLQQVADVGNATASAAHAMMSYYAAGDTAMHDPCVIAYLLQPELFHGRRAWVDIEINDAERMGESVVRSVADGEASNAFVLDTVDADGFFELLCERLARLP